jgi:DNA replication protein DnaC
VICNVVGGHENMRLIGKTGVGKNHVAQALGRLPPRTVDHPPV